MGEREGRPEPCLSCSGLIESFRTRYIIFVSEPQDQVGKDFVHCLDPIISGLVLSCTQGGQSGFMGTRLGNYGTDSVLYDTGSVQCTGGCYELFRTEYRLQRNGRDGITVFQNTPQLFRVRSTHVSRNMVTFISCGI